MRDQPIELRVLTLKEKEADKWLTDLMEHIKKQHPHLAVRWWEKK